MPHSPQIITKMYDFLLYLVPEGLAELRQIITASDGAVALTCSEGKEEDCHRKFILADLKKPT